MYVLIVYNFGTVDMAVGPFDSREAVHEWKKANLRPNVSTLIERLCAPSDIVPSYYRKDGNYERVMAGQTNARFKV